MLEKTVRARGRGEGGELELTAVELALDVALLPAEPDVEDPI